MPSLRVTRYLSLQGYQNKEALAKVAEAGASRGSTVEGSDKSFFFSETEHDSASLINWEVTSRCNNEDNSLDIISKSLDNSVKYGDTVSEKLATIVRKHYFDQRPKEKVKEIISKYNLPSNLSELVPTKVNHEVWRTCSRKKQAKMQTIQKSLVTSLPSMSLISNKLLQLSSIIRKLKPIGTENFGIRFNGPD